MKTLSALRTAAILAAVSSTALAGDVVHFVRAGAAGAGDGTSWADAFPQLTSALDVAQSGEQVWVAEGTYTPAAGGLDKSARFKIPSGVAIFGGFAGDETVLGQRDPYTHVTTLSGDLLDDDAQGDDHLKDNSLEILSADGTAEGTRLDGFTVRAAQGTGVKAGGLHVHNASIVVRRCSFIDNDGTPGGILCGQPGTTLVDECLFLRNHTTGDWSPAIYCRSGHTLDVRNSRFLGNVGVTYGGALGVYQATATVSGCLFSGNRTQKFWGGGGAIDLTASTFTCSNSTFSGNVAPVSNGGGGAMYIFDSHVELSNCVFWGDESDTPMSGQDELAVYSVDLTLDHCLLEDFAEQFKGPDNEDLDPLFVDADGADDVAGTLDDDLRVLPGSPAIDSGKNAAVAADTYDADCDGDLLEPLPLDLRRVGRFEDDPDTADPVGALPPVVDRGAFEFSRWSQLGHGLGIVEPPCLVGEGSWKPGLFLGVTLTGIKPGAAGVLIVGVAALDAPLKGGVIVPDPLLLVPVHGDPNGGVTLEAHLAPDAPSGLEVLLQGWFIDAGGAEGFIATNALSGETP